MTWMDPGMCLVRVQCPITQDLFYEPSTLVSHSCHAGPCRHLVFELSHPYPLISAAPWVSSHMRACPFPRRASDVRPHVRAAGHPGPPQDVPTGGQPGGLPHMPPAHQQGGAEEARGQQGRLKVIHIHSLYCGPYKSPMIGDAETFMAGTFVSGPILTVTRRWCSFPKVLQGLLRRFYSAQMESLAEREVRPHRSQNRSSIGLPGRSCPYTHILITLFLDTSPCRPVDLN